MFYLWHNTIMRKLPKKYLCEIYFIFTLIYFEAVFQICNFGYLSLDFLYPVLFDMSFGFLCLLLVLAVPSRMKKIIYVIILGCLSLLFIVQTIYFDVFKTFTTLNSVLNGTGQVLEFKDEIMRAVSSNIGIIFLYFCPLFFSYFVLKNCEVRILNLKNFCVQLALSQVFYLIGFLCLLLPHQGLKSTMDYYMTNGPLKLVTQRFGLIVEMKNQLRGNIEIQKEHPTFCKYQIPDPDDLYEKNVMDIDFNALMQNESDSQVISMHQYFMEQKPTRQNEYTGMFEGYNLILITAEAFSDYAIDENLTPTLYKMKNEGFVFTNFYNPLFDVSTSDGEYINVWGLYPTPGIWSFSASSQNAAVFTMGWQYQKQGIQTFAFHDHYFNYYDRHLSHPNIWKNYMGVGNGLDIKPTWPESDLEMIEKTSDIYMNLDAFHTYFMSVSGHLNYTFSGNSMSYKNYDLVKDLNLSDLSKGYLAANIEFDRAMEKLLLDLETHGKADNTLIVIAPDHYPYGLPKENIEELSKRKINDDFDLYKSALLIYSPSMKKEIVVDTPLSSIDILPTLNNLLGFEYDSRLLMGVDVFSNQKPIVALENHSFLTEDVKYNALTGETTIIKNQVDENQIRKMFEKVNARFDMSKLILTKDYYRKVFYE